MRKLVFLATAACMFATPALAQNATGTVVINGSVANDHFRSPYLVEYFVPEKHLAWFGGQQRQ